MVETAGCCMIRAPASDPCVFEPEMQLEASEVASRRVLPPARPRVPAGDRTEGSKLLSDDAGYDFEAPILELEKQIEAIEAKSKQSGIDVSKEVQAFRERVEQLQREIYANLTPWQRVQLARDLRRPETQDYIQHMFEDYVELHGDRCFGDDPAINCGFGTLGDEKVLLVAHRRGKTTAERVRCNFGSPHPEGYRKALAKMKLAEKFHLPIVTLINTPGAYPGIGAEERGQAMAIAVNLMEMSRLRTPIICTCIGEGGSGGALGIGIGDRFFILENAYYSVISPEGCAAILWKDGRKAPEAAGVLKLSPRDLRRLGIVDDIIAEPIGGAHRDHAEMAAILKAKLIATLKELRGRSIEALLEARYHKFRSIGRYLEGAEADAYFLSLHPPQPEPPEAPPDAAKPADAPVPEAPAVQEQEEATAGVEGTDEAV